MYLDHKLKEHTLLQAIARVNRKYKTKQFGTIIDYVNVVTELEEAKSMFKVEQTRDLTFNKTQLVTDLKNKWSIVMADVKGIDPKNRDLVLERFAAPDKQDTFYTHYKKFEQALDGVMPDREAADYLDDFAALTVAIQHIRNYLNKDKFSTKPYSNKILKLIDKYITSGKIKIPIESIDFDDERFGVEIKKISNKRAQNAALTGRISGIIRIGKPDNPVFYNSIEEQLNELLRLEKETQLDAAIIFAKLSEILSESQKEEQRRKELGLENGFEFAVFGELKSILNDEKICVNATVSIYEKILPLTQYVDWPDNLTVEKDMEKFIDEILTENNFPEEKIDELTKKIIDLAERHLYER